MCIALVHVDGTSSANTISALFNREELFSRPTKPLHTWANCDIIGGQDSYMLGTWKALNPKLERIVLLTNGRTLNTLGTIGLDHRNPSTDTSQNLPICSRGVLVRILASEPKPFEDIVQSTLSSSLYHSFNLIAIQFDIENYSFNICKIIHRAPNPISASLITENEISLDRYSMAESLCLIMENMGVSTFSLTCRLSQSDFYSIKGYNLAKAYSLLWQRNEHTNISKLTSLLSQGIQRLREDENLSNSLSDNSNSTSADVDLGKTLEDKLAATFIPPFMIPSGFFGTVSSSILLYSYPLDEGIFYEKKYYEDAKLNEDKEIKISFCLCKKE